MCAWESKSGAWKERLNALNHCDISLELSFTFIETKLIPFALELKSERTNGVTCFSNNAISRIRPSLPHLIRFLYLLPPCFTVIPVLCLHVVPLSSSSVFRLWPPSSLP